MLLTAQMYQEIVQSLRSDHRAVSDRRRYPRVGLRAKVNITALDEQRHPIESMHVWMRDMSAGGFGLVVRRKFTPGALLIIQLERGTTAVEPLPLLCEVVQCHSNDCIGTKILKPLSLVQPATAKAAVVAVVAAA